MHWKEILPSDRFIAYMKDRLHETDRDVLTLLYQPLIGATAFSLYMTLASELSRHVGKKIERTHKTLMIYTGKHLDEIFQERKKLEAIGLLKVYREKQTDEFVHYYELQPPMSPESFFLDDMLSVFLYNRIGSKDRYIQLRNCFKVEQVDISNHEDITRSFDQVFTSLHPSELNSVHPDMDDVLTRSDALEGRKKNENYIIEGIDFDFNAFLSFLPPFVVKDGLLKRDKKALIYKMAFLYKLTPNEMSKVVQDSILHTDELDEEEFKKQVKRRYRMNEIDKPPTLGLRVHPEALRTIEKPKTAEEEQIYYFETTSPIEFMQDWGNGAKVSPSDLEIIEKLMFDYKLEPGVVNVLLEYIFIMHDKKLNKNLAYKIASHWARANLKTVKEAMNFARKEYDKIESFQKSKETKAANTIKNTSKNVRQEPLPKWMTEDKWKSKTESAEQLSEAKKKVELYKEMLKNSKKEG
ncbi:replication initiation and membrane attachment family protein [Evansella cellulosilytica]|uniref:replication initiation and membrane attachment family protein n=1 Tax=Evansella cellulosilytica TaxID=1413 RepID=UPI0005A1B313|nr:DnaD domain protein [Evansella cellulosilytica]